MNKKRAAAARRQRGVVLPFLFSVLAGVGVVGALFFYTPEWRGIVTKEPISGETPVEQHTEEGVLVVAQTQKAPEILEEKIQLPSYVPTPSAVKAIYMSQCVVGTPSFRDDLVELVEQTELNSIVIDIKDYTGGIAFPATDPLLVDHVSSQCGARDMKDFIAHLHEKNIYVIGRITVFQDPQYAVQHPELAVQFDDARGKVWKDNKGLSFIDVGAEPFWEYIVALSREARAFGFDELNYDYVRYPSDGPVSNMYLPWTKEQEKADVLETFFAYLHEHVQDEQGYPEGMGAPATSVDLFGMTTTATNDMNIGQVFERALPHFDYIAPMVYPSHYPNGFNGWANPNTVPYEILHYVLGSAVARAVSTESEVPFLGAEEIVTTTTVPPETEGAATTTRSVDTGRYKKPVYDANVVRPWIQDFDYGGEYGPKEVRAQIQAAYDVGLHSWMLWAPSNRYTRGALHDAE